MIPDGLSHIGEDRAEDNAVQKGKEKKDEQEH
jgi:hypothetical protein